MCRPVSRAGSTLRSAVAAQSVADVGHWSSAALELRRKQRVFPFGVTVAVAAQARLPEWGRGARSGGVEGCEGCNGRGGGSDSRRSSGKTERGIVAHTPPPRILEEGGLGREVSCKGRKGGSVAGKTRGVGKSKEPECSRNSVKRRSENRHKIKSKLTPSLRSYFRVRPEVIVLTPGKVKTTQSKQVMEVPGLQVGDQNGGAIETVENGALPPLQANGCSKEMQVRFGVSSLVQSNSEDSASLQDVDPSPVAPQMLRIQTVMESIAPIAPCLTSGSSIETMILSISEDIKKGFANFEINQGEIRDACEAFERKFDILTARTQALEETVGGMKEETEIT
ncbi:hypothetical protein NDU88_004974 [Pleurodeles waltl]|uniref:Uncharacterized protein n=1 Tax=Pleurodeles waltl TaxID=8319 RepID=A0AAV7QE98_PLEWA|nr:hypothetical protein NDU88_004974 [Pleurodeles waltl]